MTYAKLFSSILASTIWNEKPTTKVVWVTMLVLKDRDGIVEGTIPGLSVLARVTEEECEQAIRTLSAPDPNSRSKVADGRRIEVCESGWRVINHDHYQQKDSASDHREKTRKRVAKWRERKAKDSTSVTASNVTEKPVTQNATLCLGLGLSTRGSRSSPVVDRPEDVPEQVWEDWLTARKQKRAPVTRTVMARIRDQAAKAGVPLADALAIAVSRGWQSFDADWVTKTYNGQQKALNKDGIMIKHPQGMPVPYESPISPCFCAACVAARMKRQSGRGDI